MLKNIQRIETDAGNDTVTLGANIINSDDLLIVDGGDNDDTLDGRAVLSKQLELIGDRGQGTLYSGNRDDIFIDGEDNSMVLCDKERDDVLDGTIHWNNSFSWGKNLSVICYLICISALFLGHPVVVFCEENVVDNLQSSSISPLDNIGFMNPKPKHLAEKFPVCDAFLKVNWIDKKKKVGYSQYEIIFDKTKERKMRWVLVWLNSIYPEAIDIYQYKSSGKLNELFNSIVYGNITSDSNHMSMVVKWKEKKIYLLFTGGDYTISDNKHTVCILYPGEERALIFEAKTVAKNLSDSEKDAIISSVGYKNITIGGRPYKDFFNDYIIIDINNDGMVDFVDTGTIIYSYKNSYKKNKYISSTSKSSTWAFPPSTKEYTLFREYPGNYLTTDGKNYFFSDKFNITEVTTQPGKEN